MILRETVARQAPGNSRALRISRSRAALMLHIPLDVNRAVLQRTGAEPPVDAGGRGRLLQPDIEDLGGDPFTQMPGGDRPPGDLRDLRVDGVALPQNPGNIPQKRILHAATSP